MRGAGLTMGRMDVRILPALLLCALTGVLSAATDNVIPPVIDSPTTAQGRIGQAFTYRITASGDAPITFAAGGLPEGLSLGGDTISGTPTEFGQFLVSLSASNLVNSDGETLALDILPLDTPSGGSLSFVDRDGDGYSDELENALNSSSTKQSSQPFNGHAIAPADALTVEKLSFKLNHRTPLKDTVRISGRIRVPDNAAANGQNFVVDVGGIVLAAALDAKGNGLMFADGSIVVRLQRTGATGVARVAQFSVRAGKRTFAPRLVDEGVTATASATAVLRINVLFDGMYYRSDVTKVFTTVPNRSSTAK